ncbi:unnamed protein product [Caenorhabditis auriculariae]|uniref:TOG domain-containing protein n=1 Tax=Caenorhabditis auriculariae TaxID=2777116 RepID=A0A8S1GQ77_9PELO|nr:unnamed protein product [Caenorhabditis auriculariae]
MDMHALSQLLVNLQSTENTVRSSAEEEYNNIPAETRTLALCTLLGHEPAVEIQTMALVLLRRIFSREFEEMWSKIKDNDQEAILRQFLERAANVQDDSIRAKYIDVISQIAHETIDEESGTQRWTGVLEFLSHCSQSENPSLKVAAMILIENTPYVFGSGQMEKFVIPMKKMFDECLKNPSSKVRSAAVKAVVSFLTENDEDDKIVKQMQPLIGPVVAVCQHIAETEEDDDGPLQGLADLAATIPKVITANLTNVMQMCLSIVTDENKNDTYRHVALEVITSYIETAPKSFKKHSATYLPKIIESCLKMMTSLDDDIQEWAEKTDDENEDEENATIGESSLDRISCALNGKTLLPLFVPVVEGFLSIQKWEFKHAALMAFSAIGEGSQRAMEPNIARYMEHICKYAGDEHPRVRYAMCNAIGQMSSDFAPTLQKKCHAMVVPALLQCLGNLDCPRVAAHAAAALINFCEECPQNVMSGYLPTIMQSLEKTLAATLDGLQNSKNKHIVEQVVTAIASVAEAAQEQFKSYYFRLMPPLVYVLDNSNVDEYKELRGKTIECISLIGTAVGKEMFLNDAINIMNSLSAQMGNLSVEDPQCSYMISSWTRFCTVLGPDFAPFLPMIMGPILRAATFSLEYAVVDDQEKQNDPSWSYHSIGDDQNFGIRTAGLEEKVTACDMLVCYARQMKENFIPWVPEVAELALKNLDFVFHDSVRQAAADVMPCLILCVKPHGVAQMRNLSSKFIPALCEAIDKELDLEVKAEHLSSLSSIVDALETDGLVSEDVERIVDLTNRQMKIYLEKKKDMEENEDEEEGDEAKEDLDEEMEMLSGYISRISEVIHSILKETHGAVFSNLIECFEVASRMSSSKHFFERQWGLCIMDDAIEFVNALVIEKFPDLLSSLTQSLKDEYPEVRQAAAYGIGIMALRSQQAGLEIYRQMSASCLPYLVEMIHRADARATEEGSVATENAIAAFAKIMRNGTNEYDLDNIIPMFMSWLPTHEDQQESVYIYGYFCDLFDAQVPVFFGKFNEHMPRILNIALSAIELDAFEDSTEGQQIKDRVAACVKKMFSNGDETFFTSLMKAAELDEAKTEILKSIISP